METLKDITAKLNELYKLELAKHITLCAKDETTSQVELLTFTTSSTSFCLLSGLPMVTVVFFQGKFQGKFAK